MFESRPVLVTRDSLMLSREGVYSYCEFAGMYFIYYYDSGTTNVNADYFGSVNNPRTFLAQSCDLPERYVFYSRSGDVIRVECDGRISVNGYHTEYEVWNTIKPDFLDGATYIAVHDVPKDTPFSFKEFAALEYSYVFRIETKAGRLVYLAFGIEREDAVQSLRDLGFTVGKDVWVPYLHCTMSVTTGCTDHPCSITHHGQQRQLKHVVDIGYFVREFSYITEFSWQRFPKGAKSYA